MNHVAAIMENLHHASLEQQNWTMLKNTHVINVNPFYGMYYHYTHICFLKILGIHSHLQ